MSDEIADNLDLIGVVIRDLDAGESILDQYHQLQTIEPVDAKIVTKVGLIYNPFGINTQIVARCQFRAGPNQGLRAGNGALFVPNGSCRPPSLAHACCSIPPICLRFPQTGHSATCRMF